MTRQIFIYESFVDNFKRAIDAKGRAGYRLVVGSIFSTFYTNSNETAFMIGMNGENGDYLLASQFSKEFADAVTGAMNCGDKALIGSNHVSYAPPADGAGRFMTRAHFAVMEKE